MQFFSLDGSDSQSNVLLVIHMCECVNLLDYSVNECLRVCWKHVLDCTYHHILVSE